MFTDRSTRYLNPKNNLDQYAYPFSSKGEKVTVKAHGGPIDIEGVTVAKVDDKVRLQSVETWFDPMEMFRQIARNGEVKTESIDKSNAFPSSEGETRETLKSLSASGGCPFNQSVTSIRPDRSEAELSQYVDPTLPHNRPN